MKKHLVSTEILQSLAISNDIEDIIEIINHITDIRKYSDEKDKRNYINFLLGLINHFDDDVRIQAFLLYLTGKLTSLRKYCLIF
ncbi:hypothetical protein [Acinetobacter venetianus]|uniref:hypothetical protein n=1 Tax=Acinetobacter venetianus TaxID=52133 RepID=UPI001022D21F|nr:hypothetical protein [Acinetobacter venetianus]RZG77931.1 hypothetical protein EXE23_16195 [Acinetobacter venetianus]